MAEQGLHARITADAGNFVTELDRAQKKAAEVSRNLNNSLGFVAKSYGNINNATTQVAQAANNTSKSFKLMRGSATQLGFQLQDIAVQAQMGTSAFTILGQQGSQIASLMGPGGALVGAAIAVASAVGGVLFTALSDTTDQMEGLEEAVDGVIGKLDQVARRELDSLIKAQSQRVKELATEYEKLANAPQTEISLMERLFNSEEEIRDFRRKWLTESVAKTAAAYQKQQDAEAKLQALIAKREELLDKIEGKTDEEEKPKPKKEKELTPQEAAKIAQQRQAARFAVLSQFDSMEQNAQQQKLAIMHERLRASLENGLITEQEFQQLSLEANAAYQEALTEKAQIEIDKRLAKEKQAQDMYLRYLQERQATTGQILNNLYQLTNTNSRKMFEIGKVAGTANAIVSTYTGAAKALELGWPLGPIAAAAITASGLAKVQAIQSQSFGGGGAGAANGATSALPNSAVQPSQPQQNQIVSINLEGEVFGRDQVRGLIGQINDALDDGYTLRV